MPCHSLAQEKPDNAPADGNDHDNQTEEDQTEQAVELPDCHNPLAAGEQKGVNCRQLSEKLQAKKDKAARAAATAAANLQGLAQ